MTGRADGAPGGRDGAAPPPDGDPDAVVCPWCGSADVERLSAFGPMHLAELWSCRACRSPFERVRRRGPDRR